MDMPKKPLPLEPRTPSKISNLTGDQLRTMRKDIEILKKGEQPVKTIVPPKNLPIVERRPDISKEAKKEATRRVFGEAMKEVGEISKKKESIRLGEESIVRPSEKSALFPSEESSKPAVTLPKSTVLPKSPIPPMPPKPVEKPETSKLLAKKNKKGFFIALIVAIVLGAVGGSAYWWLFAHQVFHLECQNFQCISVEGKGENLCQTDENCLPPEPDKPVSLIPIGGTDVVIEVLAGEVAEFLDNLNLAISKQVSPESLKRILIKKVSSSKKEYASLTELSSLMGITIPLSLKSGFGDDYTFFVYTPGMEEYDICQNAGIDDSDCFGSRLGLAIELLDKETAAEELVKWEETILDDLKSFIMSETSGETGFQYSTVENLRGASFVRYVNLPVPSVSIDYGIKDNLLIIGTSKNSFFKALDLTQ